MALRIHNPHERVNYVLEEDRSSGDPTVFELRRLTWKELMGFQTSVPVSAVDQVRVQAVLQPIQAEKRPPTEGEIARLVAIVPNWGEIAPRFAELNARVCQSGIFAIRGLQDRAGNSLELSVEKFIEHASPAMLSELCGQIFEISQLSEEERKN